MKKLLTALICVSLICTGFLASCNNKKAKDSGKVEEKVEKKAEEVLELPETDFEIDVDKKTRTAVITSYTGEETEVVIPSTVQAIISEQLTPEEIAKLEEPPKKGTTPTKKVIADLKVVGIADGAFLGNETVETVTIPEGVETIGIGTFQNCKALKSIILPESLTTIGSRAFFGCEVLSELNIGPNVNSIGHMAFSDYFFKTPWYESLTDKTVIVGDGILLKYNSTENAVFGDEVKHIAYQAFSVNPITSVTFNGTLESVDPNAFFESKPTVYLPADSTAFDLFKDTGITVKAAE